MDDKAQTRTVSMPKNLWVAIDAHAQAVGEDRSSYLRKLAVADLQTSGLLPGNPRAEILSAVEELGVEETRQLLARALRKKTRAA